MGQVEEEQHEDARLGVEAHERDHAHPGRDGDVVAEREHEPDGADGGEGHRQHHDAGLHRRLRVHVEQAEDEDQGDGQDDLEALPHPEHVLVLPAPRHRVAGRHLDGARHRLLRAVDVTADVDLRGVEVDVDVAGQEPVLVADHGRALGELHLRDLLHRDLAAARQRQEHAPQRRQIVAVVAGVADVDAVALAPLDGRALLVAADRRHHHRVGGVDGETIPGELIALQHEVEEVAARHALGVGAAGPRHLLKRRLRRERDVLDLLQLGARDLDADRGANAGREHVEASLDGHGPGVGDAREL